MNPEESTTSVTFTTDNIDKTLARKEHQYFVHIIKNPILRLLLRVNLIKPPEEKPKSPPPAPRRPVVTTTDKRPQCRVTIRISGFAIGEKKKNEASRTVIIVLAITSVLATIAAVYFAFS